MNSNLQESLQVLERRKPNQLRAQETKDKILNAIHKILLEDGIEKLTTRRIAKTGGLSMGSIYEYFPTKQAILFWVFKQRLDRALAIFRKIFSEENLSRPLDEVYGLYLAEMHRNQMWSRLDLELRNAAARDDKLQGYVKEFQNKLNEGYVKIWQHYGSSWSSDDLFHLATYLNEVDHINMKLQHRQPTETRRFYGSITNEIYRSLSRLNGSIKTKR
jgi:AcrR family transcriptional regulator